MNKKLQILGAMIALLCAAAGVSAENLMEKTYVSLRGVVGQTSLEGPAITGDLEPDEEAADGYGLQLEGSKALGDGLFVRGMGEFMQYDNDFTFQRVSLGLGYTRNLVVGDAGTVYAYAIGGLEYARSDGLEEYKGNPDFGGQGTGEDGDDVGFSVEGGIGTTFGGAWDANLYAKYYNFGEGDGPGFGVRVNYTLSEAWALLASWDGIWVEEGGYNIDLDTQRFTFGAARLF